MRPVWRFAIDSSQKTEVNLSNVKRACTWKGDLGLRSLPAVNQVVQLLGVDKLVAVFSFDDIVRV